MENIEENEQWRLNGNCDICKRKKYCTKGCKINREKKEQLLDALVREAFFKRIFHIKEEENNVENR